MEIVRIAIIGRPNVGKSRLFNRLVGTKIALVCDYAGLTRDYQEAPCTLPYAHIMMMDTPGLIPANAGLSDDLQQRLNDQTARAANLADILFFVIDAREGVTATDRNIAEWLRRFFRDHPQRPVRLLINKSEQSLSSSIEDEAVRLGWGQPSKISAEHGQGMDDLYTYFGSLTPPSDLPQSSPQYEEDSDKNSEKEESLSLETKPIRVAIMGRPNAGKSTLMNALLGEDRLLTGPEAGLTRDAIALPWSYQGRDVILIDTAGQRRKAKVIDQVERMTLHDGREALKYADVAIVVMDAEHLFEKQDLTLAQYVIDEGRVLILALNKWDQVKDRPVQWRQNLQTQMDQALGHMKGVLWFPISARQKTGLKPMLDAVLDGYKRWNRRIPTAQLNRWLKEAVERHAPPASHGVVVRAKYMTQIKSHPPTFRLFVSRATQWPESYMRYLMNHLRESFKLEGIPVRIQLRQSDNPYV